MNQAVDVLYNENRKMEYLDSQDFTDGTRKTILTTFRRTSDFEYELDLDVADFHSEDLVRLFEEEKWYTTNTFVAYRSILRKYIDWCIVCGYCDAVENPTKHVHMNQLSAVAYQDWSFKTIEDLTAVLDECYGDTDYNANPSFIMQRAMWYLAWYGFTKNEVTKLLKKNIVNDGIVTDYYEVHDVPSNVMYLLHSAMETDEVYIYQNTPYGTKPIRREFSNTPYLLRSIAMGRIAMTDELNVGTLDTWTLKTKKLQKENGFKQFLSVQKLNRFGTYARLYSWEKENEIVATNQNRLLWGHITRKMKEGDNACPTMSTFLRAYAEWKGAFYPSNQW